MFHYLEVLTQHVFFILRVKNKEFENGNCLEIFTQHGFFFMLRAKNKEFKNGNCFIYQVNGKKHNHIEERITARHL